ncbi:MAG TPA: xanthine dehydrogenase family protein molybdopterin-binding subunit [Methylomirabilota bacterium]|nr:xanthine dehydrogenase family protein molybdopterin-binding subunit [Methylomirabilota bacterium]
MIGQSPRRKEDERLLVGRGRFVDDIRPPDLLHLALVRSTHARAGLTRVDVSAARAQPGVMAFVAGDLPELAAPLPAASADATNPYVVLDSPQPQPVLARGQVRHVGEAVAAVLASDRYRAADAAEAVVVEYEPWPAVVAAEAAMREDAARVHEGQSNVVGRIQKVVGDVDRAFAEAAVVVEERLDHVRVSSMALEPRAVCASFDAHADVLTVWAGHQQPFNLRAAVASFLGLAAEQVRVIVPDTGGGFGPKIAVYPEDVLVPALAYRLRRPVKWIQTRTEFMQSTHQAREQHHHARLAATVDGRLLALDVRIVKDVGAYHYFSINEPTNTINHLPSLYRIPALRAEGLSVVTNKVPSSPYRGAGRPEAVFVVERLLDRLARRLGMDPAEVRLRNLVQPAEMPYAPDLVYRDGVPVRYDGGDYPLELRRALDLVDYDTWRKRQAELRRQGRHVGLGIAAYVEAGGSPSPGEWAGVRVDDQGQVAVSIGVSASGQGHETVFAQVCAEHLGARFEDIRVRGGDTSLVPHGYGTGASRVAINTGNAVAMAAESVRRKACRVAARLLEAGEQDIRIENGQAFVAGVPSRAIPLGRLARAALRDRALAELGGPGLWDTKFYALPTVTWASGVHVAVVEVDPETGRVTILKYVMVHDCGRQLHPVIVDGQVLGGFVQGLGVPLGERIVYDDQGQLLTGSLMDYPIPRADDVPDVVTEHLVFPTDHNPLGVRGVGEGPTCSPATVIANAVDDAFDGLLNIRDPVLTPARVRALVEAARRGGPDRSR